MIYSVEALIELLHDCGVSYSVSSAIVLELCKEQGIEVKINDEILYDFSLDIFNSLNEVFEE